MPKNFPKIKLNLTNFQMSWKGIQNLEKEIYENKP